MLELGRVQKTILLCRYLRDRDLQREINEGLNVVEPWNRGIQIIFFGKGGDIPSNHRDEQELSVLGLRVLQAAMVYINTLMIQDQLIAPGQADALTVEDKQARPDTVNLGAHLALPYGEIRLDMQSRPELAA